MAHPDIFPDLPGQTVARQQFDFLRLHAPFYRVAAHAGEGPWFLFKLYQHYRARWGHARERFASTEDWEKANDLLEIKIKNRMNWLRMTTQKVNLPVAWQEIIKMRPSDEFGTVAADVLGQLDDPAQVPATSLKRVYVEVESDSGDSDREDGDRIKRAKTGGTSATPAVTGSGSKEDPFVLCNEYDALGDKLSTPIVLE
ncbi:hypothetical protein CC2G_013485 [Coprinopsis cinerea AmutBmut pab1-1]|nr:hypothetical protein CC2G_013485 [Coprinopsis cinerea AmutBmut pab1-1]